MALSHVHDALIVMHDGRENWLVAIRLGGVARGNDYLELFIPLIE
jgi:hypothetical protein